MGNNGQVMDMWFDYIDKMDDEFRDYISHRNIGIGLFLLVAAVLWASQLSGLIDFEFLMPSLVFVGGVFFLAEGLVLRYLVRNKGGRR